MNPLVRTLLLSIACCFAVVGEATGYPESSKRVPSKGNTTYHIDPVRGDDANTGLTKIGPWKTFHPVNRLTLAPGDRVEVNPGRFDHTLSLTGWGNAEKPIEVRFAAGRYDFDPVNARREAYQISNTNGDPEGLKAVGLHIKDAKHVRITGPGAVIHARGKMMHVCIDGGEHVTIDGLAFDYHRPTVSEFKVTATGADFAELVVHKDSAYTVTDESITWQGEGWAETGGLGQELDLETGRVHRLRDPLAGLRFEETKPFHIRAHGKHRLKAGRIYQIRNPFRDYCGAFTRNSRDITWSDVHFRFIHGMGIVSQFSENLTFDGVRIAPDPAGGRTTAAWADCIQASGCRGKIVVRNCVFSGAHDDAINIHGTHLRVVETMPDRREIKVRFVHDQTFGFDAFLPGDEVEFVRWDSLATFAPNRVVKSALVDPKTMLLQLDKPLPADIRENDVLENVTWTPEVEIRGCKVMHIPTRGFLITTRRPVLVEDNDFLATHMPAILIENDASGWFESGCVRDMLIRDNRFHHCGEPVIHINPRNSVRNPKVHQNIRIENNDFHLRGRSAVGAKSTSGLHIVGNRIHSAQSIKGDDWLHTSNCENVRIHDNEFSERPTAQLIPYAFPAELPVSNFYSASIGGSAIPALQTKIGAFLSFGMTGPLEVKVKFGKAPKAVVVRPLSAGIKAEIAGDTLRFNLPRPMNLSIEIDGNLVDPLFVFANPELAPPDRNDPKVRYYEAGKIHDAGEILLGDGETLYLEGGAVVRGEVRARNARNVAVRGAGILDASTRKRKINMLVLRECRDAVIENLILLDPLGWTMHLSGSENIRVSNTRVIGWRANSDGLDIEHSSKVQVDGCFWRTNDDCIAIKAIYPPGVQGVPFEEMINPETLGGHDIPRIEGGVMEDITISNCVLWNDSGGQGFEIGFELRVDTIRGITFRDSDIIHVAGGGAFTIHNGDRAHIHDLLIANIRVEDTDRLVDFHVGLSIYSYDCPPDFRRSNPQRKAPPMENLPKKANNPYQWYVPAAVDLQHFENNRGLVRDVIFRNVKVASVPRSGSILNGYSETRGISGVTFDNLTIDGRPIRSAEEADLFMENVHDVRFHP